MNTNMRKDEGYIARRIYIKSKVIYYVRRKYKEMRS